MGIGAWIDRLLGIESLPGATQARVTESILDGGYDPDFNLGPTQGGSQYFRRLSKTNRELDTTTWDRQLALSHHLFVSNPMAKRYLELQKDFVVGSGVTVEIASEDEDSKEELGAVVSQFWDDALNKMDLRVHDLALELGLAGESIISATVNPVSGHVRLGTIDPAMVTSVICDPMNAEVITDLVLAGDVGGGQRVKVIRIDETPGSATYGRMAGVETDQFGKVETTWKDPSGNEHPYAGQAFYFKINSVSGARRGCSDLLTVIDWLDALDQMLAGEVDRALLMKSFVWDVTVDGANDTLIADYANKNPAPKPGSVRYHNDKVHWVAVTPDLKPMDAQITADLLLQWVATGLGLPKAWLNATENTNRATLAEMGEPSFKKLESRQRFFRDMLCELIRFVFDQAELHGRIATRPVMLHSLLPEPWPFEVNTPEMRATDVTKVGNTLMSVTSGLVKAIDAKILDIDVAQQVIAVVAGQMGVEVNLEDMRARLEAAKAEAALTTPAVPVVSPQPLFESTRPKASGLLDDPAEADDILTRRLAALDQVA